MNQNDLVAAVANQLQQTQKQGDAALSAALAVIADALQRGEEVRLHGFGTFELVDREARQGRNPQTGAAIEIAASRTVKFKPANAQRDGLSPAAGKSA